MIGIQDILETTAPLHGGRRITDQVRVATPKNQTPNNETQPANTNWHKNTTKRMLPRRGGNIIALPGISDELSRYRSRSGWNRAA